MRPPSPSRRGKSHPPTASSHSAGTFRHPKNQCDPGHKSPCKQYHLPLIDVAPSGERYRAKFSIKKLEKEGRIMTELHQPYPLSWKKSTASGGGGCVEVAKAGGMVFIRDSKDPSGSILSFSRKEWGVFLIGARADHYHYLTQKLNTNTRLNLLGVGRSC
jgi:hypothetical protein